MYIYYVLRCKGWSSVNKEMMKGSIDLLLLSVLANDDMYDYEIVQKKTI